ncbi:pentapeptide repeat-containing protein [Nocardia sp. NPDC050193]
MRPCGVGNLGDADLSGADPTGADLIGAQLHNAVLAGADLTGTDLTGADLDGTKLTDAVHDHQTRWPDGFTRGYAGWPLPAGVLAHVIAIWSFSVTLPGPWPASSGHRRRPSAAEASAPPPAPEHPVPSPVSASPTAQPRGPAALAAAGRTKAATIASAAGTLMAASAAVGAWARPGPAACMPAGPAQDDEIGRSGVVSARVRCRRVLRSGRCRWAAVRNRGSVPSMPRRGHQ